MSYLDVLIRKVLQVDGTNLPEARLWNLASGATATHNPSTGALDIVVTGGGGGADAGKTVKAMADANQTLTDAQGRKGLVQTTGSLTANRTLTFDAPPLDTNSYSTPVLNACSGGSIVVSVGTGNEVIIDPGSKALVQISASGVGIIVDLPLDPRDFGCPWNGVDDDLPGFEAMLAIVPNGNAKPVVIQLPKGPGYFSDNLNITRNVLIYGHGMTNASSVSQGRTTNALIFPPLKGVIMHGFYTSPDYPLEGQADNAVLEDVNVVCQQAIASDSVGNWGHSMFHMSTTLDVWSQLPTNVIKGTCVLRSGATVGSTIGEYYGDGHTRDTTHLVMFRCTTAGTKGSGQPAAFATAGIAQLGSTIAATGGSAVWTVESLPKDYGNGTTYAVGQRIVLPGDNTHVFQCEVAGTSVALSSTTISAASDGVAFWQTTINVADTSTFPPSGVICVVTTEGRKFVSYASKTGTTFDGCSDIDTVPVKNGGTMSTGDVVTGPYPGIAFGVPVRCAGNFLAPAYDVSFYDTQARVTAGSDGATLPQATIDVTATSGFAASGNIKVWTGAAYATVAYTGKTDTTFTGCTGGTGTMSTGNEVGQGVKWRQIGGPGITVLGNWCSMNRVGVYGATGAAIWLTANYRTVATGGSNFWKINKGIWGACGEGLVVNSFDCNGGESSYCQQIFMGGGRTNVDAAAYLNLNGGVWADGMFGNGGGAIKDRCLGVNRHNNHYIQFSGGIPYRNDLLAEGIGNGTVWTFIAQELELDPFLLHPATVVGAVHGYGGNRSNATIVGETCSGLRARTPWLSDITKTVDSVHGPVTDGGTAGAWRMKCSSDSYYTDYHPSDEQLYWPTGWWVFGKAQNPGFYQEQVFGFPRPGVGATLPSGGSLGGITPMWLCQDYAFFGQDPSIDPHALGFSTSFGTIGALGQYFKAGSVLFNRSAVLGTTNGWRCTVGGTPGTWVPMECLAPAPVAVAALEIDWAAGLIHTKTLAAGANAFTFANATAGQMISVVVTGAASTLTWPTVKCSGGVVPTQTASGTDIYTLLHDGTDIHLVVSPDHS